MSEEPIPILDPESSPISDHISNHLARISIKISRYMAFWEMKDVINTLGPIVSADAKAAVITPPEEPWFVIVINPKYISKERYDAETHDPLLAHEAEHAVLLSEGYLPISFQNQSDENRWAISSINNWLDDPYINGRLQSFGFDISADRIQEIEDIIAILKSHGWPRNLNQRTLRIGASFLSEPNIPGNLLHQLGELLEKSLGREQFRRIESIVSLLTQSDLSSFETYNNLGEELLNHISQWFGLEFAPIIREPFRSFSQEEVSNWAAENITLRKRWP